MKDGRTPAERLVLARIRAGYDSPAAFYKAHGIPQGTYANHESGERGIRRDKAEEYARLLGNCTAAWIMYGDGDGPTDRSVPAAAALTKKEGMTATRRHEETASFLLIYDRLSAITEKNEKATVKEFGVVFRQFGYDPGPRGICQLAFRLWQDIVAEDDALSLPERALKKIAWIEDTFDKLMDLIRQIPRGPDAAE